MKDSFVSLVKRCLLFYILFNFFSLAASFFFSAVLNVLPDIRVINLSFYYFQPVLVQIILLLMDLYILAIIAVRYFRLLLSFVNADENEDNCILSDLEKQNKKTKTFNKRIMFIVFYLTISIIISSTIQFLGLFDRY